MRSMHTKIRISAAWGLLLLLCVCAFSGALAEEERSIEITILQETTLLNAMGKSQGTLLPGQDGGVSFQSASDETITDVRVVYLLSDETETEINNDLVGQTKVQLQKILPNEAAATEQQDQTAASEGTLPPYGWIDSDIVIAALRTAQVQGAASLAEKDAEIARLQQATPLPAPAVNTPVVTAAVHSIGGFLSAEQTAIWLPLAALGIGLILTGLMAWIAVNLAKARRRSERTPQPLETIAEKLTEGITIKAPVQVEQIAWPSNGSVPISCQTLDQLAIQLEQVAQLSAKRAEPEEIVAVELPPVPEGEEPDLLELANSLAGIISPVEWQDAVKDAKWHAVLLKTNPNEKGTYIIDEGGYSIIACLMRDPDAAIGYVLPSYMDANASEPRWNEFYYVTEDMSVRNFRVDALPVVFVERGAFFLQKTMGRLTRRKQY